VKKELLKTPYRPKCVTVASRDHLCVNPFVRLTGKTGDALRDECREKKKSCGYYDQERTHGIQRDMSFRGVEVPWTPLDVEELYKLGKS
jgi:hypothetical protein